MQERIKGWATKFGLKTEQVENGVGALLGFVRSKVPAAQWEQVKSRIPQAEEWVERARLAGAATQGAAQGLMGQAAEMLEKASGSAQWGLSQLVGQLQQAGFKPENALSFAGEVMGQLKSTVGKDKFDKLIEVAPPLRNAMAGLGKILKKPDTPTNKP